MSIRTITSDAIIRIIILSDATIQVTETKTISAGADIAGTTFKSINANASIILVKTNTIDSSAVIITGEPNVKLYMEI